MKIAVFYENTYDGVQATGADMEKTLAGFRAEGMELLYLSPDSWKRDRETLAPMLRKLDIGIEGMHGWCDFSADPDSSRYRDMIDLAVEAGAGNLLIIPGMLQTDDTSHATDAMVQGMRKAVYYGREKGIPVLMEDFDGLLSPYNSIFGLQYFMNAVDGLGCAFDTGNFVIFHENELKAFDLFADKIQTVHLKDRSMDPVHPNGYPNICADQKPAWACAIGSGYIHIREILHRLTARNYTGNIIVELYGDDPSFVLEDVHGSLRWLHQQGY